MSYCDLSVSGIEKERKAKHIRTHIARMGSLYHLWSHRHQTIALMLSNTERMDHVLGLWYSIHVSCLQAVRGSKHGFRNGELTVMMKLMGAKIHRATKVYGEAQTKAGKQNGAAQFVYAWIYIACFQTSKGRRCSSAIIYSHYNMIS